MQGRFRRDLVRREHVGAEDDRVARVVGTLIPDDQPTLPDREFAALSPSSPHWSPTITVAASWPRARDRSARPMTTDRPRRCGGENVIVMLAEATVQDRDAAARRETSASWPFGSLLGNPPRDAGFE